MGPSSLLAQLCSPSWAVLLLMVTLGGGCESLLGTVLAKVLGYPVVVAVGRGQKEGKAGFGWGSHPASPRAANTSV